MLVHPPKANRHQLHPLNRDWKTTDLYNWSPNSLFDTERLKDEKDQADHIICHWTYVLIQSNWSNTAASKNEITGFTTLCIHLFHTQINLRKKHNRESSYRGMGWTGQLIYNAPDHQSSG